MNRGRALEEEERQGKPVARKRRRAAPKPEPLEGGEEEEGESWEEARPREAEGGLRVCGGFRWEQFPQ